MDTTMTWPNQRMPYRPVSPGTSPRSYQGREPAPERTLSREERQEAKRLAEEANFSFAGYQVVRREFISHRFDPAMTIRGNSITFNNSCISKLEDATYIQFLINPEERKLAIRPCEEGARDAVRWCVVRGDKRKSREIDALRNSFSSKDRRLGEMLFSNLSKGEVTYSDYVKRGEETRYKIDLFLALQIGLVEKIDANRFRILKHLSPELPKLTKAQKRVASEIYESFGEGRFSAEMVLASLNYTDGTVWAYLHNFTLLKILDCQKDGVNQYQFRITPQEHPECFDITA